MKRKVKNTDKVVFSLTIKKHNVTILLSIEVAYSAIQSNLVISNSLISNYRLSRSENLVPVLTRNYDNR